MKVLKYVMVALLGIGFAGADSAFAQRDDRGCNDCGTVVAVQQIRHKDTRLGAGTAIGAVAGGVLGSTIGKGGGRTAATVGGAVAGGAIGHQVEKNNREARYSWRFTVRMDDGRSVSITQGDNPDIRRGDRVRVWRGHVDRY
jgi:outer membrane lipoprotein SlyB